MSSIASGSRGQALSSREKAPSCIQMTWAFFEKSCDEAYAIIDAIDTPKTEKALNAKALAAFLGAL
jgi:hypothetical protein